MSGGGRRMCCSTIIAQMFIHSVNFHPTIIKRLLLKEKLVFFLLFDRVANFGISLWTKMAAVVSRTPANKAMAEKERMTF